MKKFTLFTLLLVFGFIPIRAQLVTLPPSGDNQKSVVTQYMGSLAYVKIIYNSPDVHASNGEDRRGKIWGQLVPYGMNDLGFGLRTPAPWRAGANENTVFEFSHDVLIQGKPLKAGRYGFHIIVEEEGPWTLIFSNNSTAWGSFFYQENENALRVQAIPGQSEYHEWLTYEFTDRRPDRCTVALKWEDIQLPFTIEVQNIKNVYVENLRKQLQSMSGFNYQGWMQAAQYCLQNDVNLEEALAWAENAVSLPFIGQRNFSTLQTKGSILEKLGRKTEAQAVMEEAIKDPSAQAFQIHQYGRQLIADGQKEKALEIFQYNHERFKGAWPTEVGLARGYSAVGEYEKAAKHAQIAAEQAPDDLNRNSMKNAIEKLKKKEDIN
jgi:tetratricopeptide (TPR) repeat protein